MQSLGRGSGNRYRSKLLIRKKNAHINNKKDAAQLYSEVVQSYHYYRDPSTHNKESRK